MGMQHLDCIHGKDRFLLQKSRMKEKRQVKMNEIFRFWLFLNVTMLTAVHELLNVFSRSRDLHCDQSSALILIFDFGTA